MDMDMEEKISGASLEGEKRARRCETESAGTTTRHATSRSSGGGGGVLDAACMKAVLQRVGKAERRALSSVSKAWYAADGASRRAVRVFNCYGAAPARLVRRFPNLERVKIKGRPRADDYSLVRDEWGGFAAPWVRAVAGAYPATLTALHLKRMVVTDADLAMLARALPGLQELTLELCRRLSTAGLACLADCRALRALSLRASVVGESDDGGDDQALWLRRLAANNRGVVEVLDIDCVDARCVDVRDLEALAPSLKVLRVPFDLPLRALEGVLRRARGLTALGAGGFADESEVAEEDHRVRVPRTLVSLSGLQCLPDSYVPQLRWVAPNLRELDLRAAPALSETGYIQLLSWCSNLEELQVDHHVGDKVLQAVGRHCKKLRKLYVERVGEDEDANVTQCGVTAVAEGCAHLSFFLCYAADMTNAALSAVGRHCPNMRDFRFVLVEGCKVYTEATLDDGVKQLLIRCPRLTRLALYVRKGFLTDAGLEHIGTYGGNLRALLLGCAGTSGMGMAHLLGPGGGGGGGGNGCRRLEKLEIRDCPVSGRCLAELITGMFPDTLLLPSSSDKSSTASSSSRFSMRYLWLQNAHFQGEEILALEGRVKPCKPNVHVEFVMPSPEGADGHVEHHHPFSLFAYCALDGARTDRPPTSVELG